VEAFLVLRSARYESRPGVIECHKAQVIIGRIGACVFFVPNQLPNER